MRSDDVAAELSPAERLRRVAAILAPAFFANVPPPPGHPFRLSNSRQKTCPNPIRIALRFRTKPCSVSKAVNDSETSRGFRHAFERREGGRRVAADDRQGPAGQIR